MKHYTFSFYQKGTKAKVILPKWWQITKRLRGEYSLTEIPYWYRKSRFLKMNSKQEEEFIRIVQDKNHPLHKCIFQGYDEVTDIHQAPIGADGKVWGVQLEMHNQGTNYIKTYNNKSNNHEDYL